MKAKEPKNGEKIALQTKGMERNEANTYTGEHITC
jgi:hypothetical protein